MSKQNRPFSSFEEYCKSNSVESIQQEQIVVLKKPEKIKPNKYKDESITPAKFNLLEDPLYHDTYYNNGQKQAIKNLRTGKYKIIKMLDLHNFRQNEAILKLESFINGNITPGNTCLKIIHGKGLNSIDGKAVIRSIVRRFLEHHPRLIAYTNADERNGGDGITLVKLKN